MICDDQSSVDNGRNICQLDSVSSQNIDNIYAESNIVVYYDITRLISCKKQDLWHWHWIVLT